MKKGDTQKKILKDIKEVKVQGAENVARAGVQAFLLDPTKKSSKKILKVRPTEPLLQNFLKILLKSKDKKSTAKKILKDLENSHNQISKVGAKLIKNNMKIYSHCHSSTVMDILKYAKKKQKKKFTVYTTEVEPLLQGRKTARDLAKSKIKVIVAPDLAAEHLLSECDLFLFGADAFTKSLVANKIGTSTLVRLAKDHKIPRYSCGVSMKFTNKVKIEKRKGSEVWKDNDKRIFIYNPAFDKTKLKDLSGVITEFGILNKKQLTKVAKEKINSF